MPVIRGRSVDSFTRAYLETALWSSLDEAGTPMDMRYGLRDFTPEAIAQALAECRQFQADNSEDIGDRAERAGHDFWLTRNRHGGGFWDGDWPADAGKRLAAAARAWGSADIIADGDGNVSFA